jgi:hypothetical protein
MKEQALCLSFLPSLRQTGKTPRPLVTLGLSCEGTQGPSRSDLQQQEDPESSKQARPAANRTGWRSCCAQYSGWVASSGVIHFPVRLEMYGTCGGFSSIRPSSSVKTSSIGDIIPE